jgi:hypothetical protein
LRHRYGIGGAEFVELVRAQGGRCLICGRLDPQHVDHDHVTGQIRGVLCFNCNGGVGQFADDPERRFAAAAYLLTSREPNLGALAMERVRALRVA